MQIGAERVWSDEYATRLVFPSGLLFADVERLAEAASQLATATSGKRSWHRISRSPLAFRRPSIGHGGLRRAAYPRGAGAR